MEEILKDIAITIFAIWAAIYGFLFYSGKLKLSEKQETTRGKMVNKYGGIIFVAIMVLATSAIVKLITTLNKLYIYLKS